MPLDGTNFEQQDAVLDVLQRAREMLARPSGWSQGYEVENKGVCLLVAVNFSTSDQAIGEQAAAALYEALPDTAKTRDVIEYNDDPDRTQAEIVALLDRAIAKREAEPQTGGIA